MRALTIRAGFLGRLSLTAVLLLTACQSAIRAPSTDPRLMEFPPVSFRVPNVDRRVLSNGMVIYLLEDHELPLVTVQAMIRSGSVFDPPEKLGRSSLAGTVIRSGGTDLHPGDALDEELERMAADLHVSIGTDSGSAVLDVLSRDLNRGLALFADLLRNPVFPDGKIELARQQEIEWVRRRNDEPGRIAGREFAKLVFGPDHPSARDNTIDTLNAINRDDLIAVHARHFGPDAVIVGVTGDFEANQVIETLEQLFGDWRKSDPPQPVFSPAEPVTRQSVNLVQRSVSQSYIRIGHLGIKQSNPDYFAMAILNDLLGGSGFRSRLFQEVRTRKGLAYSVGSAFVPGNLDLGVFVAYADTKSESSVHAIETIQAEIRRIRQERVGDEELELAKDAFLNSFVFSFSDPSQIVSRLMSLEFYGLPKDYLDRFRDRVLKITPEEISEVAQRYLNPDALVILVVGDEKSLGQPLTALGPTTRIEIDLDSKPEGVK